MLTPPDDLPGTVLASALERFWGLAVASMQYRPVGWGSHHWEVADAAGTRWFVTADDVENKRVSAGEPVAAGFERLRASLAAAMDLRDGGAAFVLAPVATRDGEPLARVRSGFGVAVYPFVDGQSFSWGGFSSPGHQREVLGLVVAVHTAPATARRRARADDFTVPHRDQLEASFGPGPGRDASECGPYALPVSRLVREHAAPLRQLLARYDELVAQARAEPAGAVLTHGEPHPGNTMRTADEWLLIDWDTALVAPPERDLWFFASGNGGMLDVYADATGVTPRPALLDLYRLRWDLADVAIDVSRFRRPHPGNAEDDKAWEFLTALIERVTG